MTGSIILYSARSPLTADHQAIYLPLPGGHVDTLYIRAVRAPGVAPIDAIDIMDPMDGETFLNSIPEGAFYTKSESRLAEAEALLLDLIALADAAMKEANNDGAEYDRQVELHDVRAFLAGRKQT